MTSRTQRELTAALSEERTCSLSTLRRRWKLTTGPKDLTISGLTLLRDVLSECGSHGMVLKSGTLNRGTSALISKTSMITAKNLWFLQPTACQSSSNGLSNVVMMDTQKATRTLLTF